MGCGWARDGDEFEVGAEVCGEGDAGGCGVKPLEATGAVGGAIAKIELGHEAEGPAVGEGGCEGEDDSAGPSAIAHPGMGGEGEVRHEGEGGFATVIAPEIAFDAQGDVSESIGVGAVAALDLSGDGVGVEDDLDVGVLGDTPFEVYLAKDPL